MKARMLAAVFLIVVSLSEGSVQAMASPQELGQQAANTPGTPKGETLTNQSIIEMVKAGLASDLIVSRINESDVNFDLSTDGLIALREAQVPGEIIRAMIVKQEGGRESDTASSSTIPPDIIFGNPEEQLKGVTKIYIKGDETMYIIEKIFKELPHLQVVGKPSEADVLLSYVSKGSETFQMDLGKTTTITTTPGQIHVNTKDNKYSYTVRYGFGIIAKRVPGQKKVIMVLSQKSYAGDPPAGPFSKDFIKLYKKANKNWKKLVKPYKQ